MSTILKEIRSQIENSNYAKYAIITFNILAFTLSNCAAQNSKNQEANIEYASNNDQEGYEGNIAVCTVMVIESEHEDDADSVWDRHKKWLKETHGPWGMVSYTVAKNPEFKNPLNPASTEKTGKIIYVIHEVYRHIDGLNKHYSESANGGYVEDFLKIASAEGTSVTVLQGSVITHSLLPKDCDFPVLIAKDNGGVEKFFDKK